MFDTIYSKEFAINKFLHYYLGSIAPNNTMLAIHFCDSIHAIDASWNIKKLQKLRTSTKYFAICSCWIFSVIEAVHAREAKVFN